MTALKVLLVEDHTLIRQGVRALLEKEPDIRVVGEVGDSDEALLLVERLQPDIVLMDISLPGIGGVEATRRIHARFPKVHILVLSMHKSEAYVSHALRAGASGYVLKQSTATELVLALRALAAGGTFLSPAISQILISDYVRHAEASAHDDTLHALTPRERQVLKLIATGLSNRQIAEKLRISVKTVETHRGNMMGKLGVHDRAGLVACAIKGGLLRIKT